MSQKRIEGTWISWFETISGKSISGKSILGNSIFNDVVA